VPFRTQNLGVINRLVAFAQPDFFSMDPEAFPEFSAWVTVAAASANFQRRQRLSGETTTTLAIQIAQGWIGGAVAAARAGMKTRLFAQFYTKNDHFATTGSGQT